MSSLIERDLKHIWHPCTQMKDYESEKLLEIVRASGDYFYLQDGKKILDAISSWWCKSLGHQHPRLKLALKNQIEKFEHVIFANTTNETIVNLSEKLAKLTSSLNKIFYASDGSCAVEIAMKMSLHTRIIQGDTKRNQFIALENSYHGETLGALSVSDLGIYRSPYHSILLPTHFIKSLPYVNNINDEMWNNCEIYWEKIEKQLQPLAENTTAILIEPIVQGAGGMKIFSQDFLKRLRAWTNQHGIHLIVDEIMTGIGRTGKMLAIEHANIEPDFLCLSKGLTSGWLPLSVMLTSQQIYDLFYDDDKSKSFLHSHTHSGNVLAASVALEVLNIFEDEKIIERVGVVGDLMANYMHEIADETKQLVNVRNIGGIVAADYVGKEADQYYGKKISCNALERGVLLRPLGNTIYWLPPLNVSDESLIFLRDVTAEAINF